MASTSSQEKTKQNIAIVKPKSAPVIPLPTKKIVSEVVKKAPRPKLSWFRKHAIALSAVICVLLPGLLGTLYFSLIASDRYAAGAGFSVRSMDTAGTGGDFLGALSGLSSVGSTTSDSYIIQEFLTSRELVEKLKLEADFLNAYSSKDIDFFYRLDPELPIEEVIEYWHWMIAVSYENASELIEFEVQAFTPEDAEKIALLVTKYSQELINKLSSQARRDAVHFSEREVASAEVRLKLVREDLRNFRARTNAINPESSVAALTELTTSVEARIIEQRTRLSTLRQSLSDSSPSVKNAQKALQALEDELATKRAEISSSSQDTNLAGILADFERLQVEQEFAQQAYSLTLASLGRARAEADRQQRFLAVFKEPARPSSAIYPHRIMNSFLVFIVAVLLWAVGVMLFFSVRDHLR